MTSEHARQATGSRAAILEHLWGCAGTGEVSFEEFAVAAQMERDGLIKIRSRRETHWMVALTDAGREERDRGA